MRNILTVIILSILLVSCGSNDQLITSQENPLIGEWELVFGSLDSVVSDVPPDTMVYNGDLTGKYKSTIGWGAYEFDYRLLLDSIILTRTVGQSEGSVERIKFEIKSDSLIINKYYPSSEFVVRKFRKL